MPGHGKLSVIFLTLFALGPCAASATIGFKRAVSYQVGRNPVAVAAGDFDGDGKIDLAVVNNGNASAGDDGGLSILLGNGDGTFHAAVNVAAGKNPTSIAVGDFNADNLPDVAVINADGGGGNVGILLGNGDGTFQSPVDYPTGNGPNMVAVGDFNGDDKPDLVVVNGTDSTVSVLLANGDGTFRSRVMDFTTGGGTLQQVAVADFNGDGKADLALPTGAILPIWLGKGDGTFLQSVTFSDFPSGVFHLNGIVTGDFNDDRKPDVLVSFKQLHPESVTDGCVLLVGNGDGSFQLGGGCGVGPGNMLQADFNGDGKLDVVQSGSQQVAVWAGNGDGTFQTAVTFTVGSSSIQSAVATADFNGDKLPDIVVTNTEDNTISILLNVPDLNPVSPDFSIAASPANPSIVSRGQSATSTVSLTSLNVFDNPVSLACSVQPAQSGSPTCSVDPNSVSFDASGNATAQLTIAAGTAAASLTQPFSRPPSQPRSLVWLPIAGLVFAGAGFGGNNSTRKRILGFVIGIFLISGLISQSACVGRGRGPNGGGGGGPQSQTYNVTVEATSGFTQHSATVTVFVM